MENDLILADMEAPYNPNDDYPPVGTPETALVILINESNFSVIAHTGRFFHGQCNCAGMDGEEIGLEDVPSEPGVWVFEKGKAWSSRSFEGEYDCGMGGDWRKATFADLLAFGFAEDSPDIPFLPDTRGPGRTDTLTDKAAAPALSNTDVQEAENAGK